MSRRERRRKGFSAGSFHVLIGLPDEPSQHRGMGSLRAWCSKEFDPAYERFMAARPEMRARQQAPGYTTR